MDTGALPGVKRP